jgi:hypothetical protein
MKTVLCWFDINCMKYCESIPFPYCDDFTPDVIGALVIFSIIIYLIYFCPRSRSSGSVKA